MDNQIKETKSIKWLLIIIFTVVILIAAGTFAWLSFTSQKTKMYLVIGDIDGLQVTLKPYQINGSITPVSTYTDGEVINVTSDNKKGVADDFKLFYKITSIDSALVSSDFKYTVTKSTDNGSTYTVVKNGNFSTAASGNNLEVYKETVQNNTKYLYKVYLWIDSTGGNQSSMQGKVFQGELRASISENLYTVMRDNAVIDNKASAFVTSATGINWNRISSNTNGKGIYLRAGTENDPYPIYYYRGAVTNNNVLFGGFCWKIVRTTDTGGVKVVYNGLPSGTNNDECTNTTGTSTQLAATSAFNSSKTSPAYLGYMYGTVYTHLFKIMTSISDIYMYGTSYDSTTGKLNTTNAMNFAGTDWATYYNQLNNNHYTCFNTSGECSEVYYIYYTNSSTAYYIQLPNDKTISGVLDEMLTSSSNTTNSTIKMAIDNWYQTNMTSQTSKLEDTPFCNDRTIYQLNGWNPNGGSTTSNLYLGAYGRTAVSPYTPILSCNTNDAFTLPGNASGNGKLTYPVGLLTADEIRLAGGINGTANTTYYLYTGQFWWSGSPNYFFYSASGFSVDSSGGLNGNNVGYTGGVRPSVSLKHGTKFSDGDGTSTNPYVVE